jgi:Flp pilus assembly protein protease CpaA
MFFLDVCAVATEDIKTKTVTKKLTIFMLLA